MELTTLSVLKEMLGIDSTSTSEDSRLTRIIKESSDRIAELCDRNFAEGTYSDKFIGIGTQKVYLKQRPVTEVLSIVFNDSSTDDATNYEIVDNIAVYRKLGFTDGRWGTPGLTGDTPDPVLGTRNIEITYVAGYKALVDGTDSTDRNLPYSLEGIALQLCEYLYNNSPMNRNIQSEKIGGYSWTYGKMSDRGIPNHIIDGLNSGGYRRIM